ncbi:transporter substrate-binding domain-containing protein [Sneathiella sp. P13V-1]|uniref:transporter substrate-binding domain-containing protein n=1 Tax=Sneathiella sp. P13V-1 TaxID=2697366 RepID=UPI00187B4BAB|nr:transporter substrate-binding domain-containing protein [Sneathiella sp. P13V-1]MBE7637342.1 transporter substrate-binding domain-containing protein [Sneathiella sp. P13V-1]
MNYDYALVKLALEKTISSYGSYRIERTPVGLNYKRAYEFAKSGLYKNFFLRAMVSDQSLNELRPVYFPIDRGITGYRIALISSFSQSRISKIETLEDLKKFQVVQGIGWPDTNILKSNGVKVVTGPGFESMREMVAHGRVDMFLRGANEVEAEVKNQKLPVTLYVESEILIHYPFPRFFFTTKDNHKAAKRLSEGLKLACEDGSFLKLWSDYFGKSIHKLNLSNRKYIKLENPYLEKISSKLNILQSLPAECKEIAIH